MSSDVIRMTIPALLAYARLPRVAIAGLATRSGFSYDEVEAPGPMQSIVHANGSVDVHLACANTGAKKLSQ